MSSIESMTLLMWGRGVRVGRGGGMRVGRV